MAALNSTRVALLDAISLKGKAVVDPTAPKFTGTVTCYTDPATGLVACLQLGATAPVLCSTTAVPRTIVVPADSYISSVKADIDPATGLVTAPTNRLGTYVLVTAAMRWNYFPQVGNIYAPLDSRQ